MSGKSRAWEDEFASLRDWTRRSNGDLREPPPIAPRRCDRHGEDTVEIAYWGQRAGEGVVCVFCMRDPRVTAGALYASDVERYEASRAEYDALTGRIAELEREIAR